MFWSLLEHLVVTDVFGKKNDGKVGLSEMRLSTEHRHVTARASHSLICMNKNVIKISKYNIKEIK